MNAFCIYYYQNTNYLYYLLNLPGPSIVPFSAKKSSPAHYFTSFTKLFIQVPQINMVKPKQNILFLFLNIE